MFWGGYMPDMIRHKMTIEDARRVAYEALSKLDDLLLSEPEDEIDAEMRHIRNLISSVAGGVLWLPVPPEQRRPTDPRAPGGIGYDGAPGPGPGE